MMRDTHHSPSRWRLVLLLSIFAIASCVEAPPPPPVVQLKNLPVDTLQLRVISKQRKEVTADISDPTGRGYLAMALEANGLGDLAVQEYQAANILDGTDPLWRYREACVRIDQGSTPQGIDLLVGIAREFPSFVPAWHRLAGARLQLHQDEQAQQDLEKLLSLVPTSIRARTTKAQFLLDSGDALAALKELEQVTQQDRNYEWAYRLLGRTYLKLGETGPTVENFLKQTLGSSPKYEEDPREKKLQEFRAGRDFEKRLCRELIRQSRGAVAATRLRQAIRDFPGDLSLRLILAQAYQSSDDDQAAMKEIAEIIKMDSKHVPAYLMKIDMKIQRGDQMSAAGTSSQQDIRAQYGVAAMTARAALTHAPGDWRVQFARGRAETKLGNDSVALTHLKKARELEQSSAEVCMWLFEVAWRTGAQDVARSSIEAASQLNPGNIFAWVNLGMLHARNQELESARNALERARAIDPNHAAVQALQQRINTAQSKP